MLVENGANWKQKDDARAEERENGTTLQTHQSEGSDRLPTLPSQDNKALITHDQYCSYLIRTTDCTLLSSSHESEELFH